MKKTLSYILITPARNEEKFIEKTLKSVVGQTMLPYKWIIISDGSTDKTDEIIKSYSKDRNWIELIRLPERKERHFAAKVNAFNAGYERIKNVKYDIIGCLDADISFEENDYFEYLLDKFLKDQKLGVAGTDYKEGEFHSYKDSNINAEHVNGGCQLFRRECFEDIGGYKPIKLGGIDWVAVTTARMRGWKTRSFQDKIFIHNAKIGRTYGNKLLSKFNYGKKDYFCGGHPLWELFRITFQMTKKPYIIGGLYLFFGYFLPWAGRKPKEVPPELIRFYRQEQMERLNQMISNKFRNNKKLFNCKYYFINIFYKIINKANRALLSMGFNFMGKREVFDCPVCGYHGIFYTIYSSIGARKHAICPQCGSFERQRLQYLALENLSNNYKFNEMSILHFAPEAFLKKYFQHKFKRYISTDLLMKNVDLNVDISNLPFKDKSFNFIFASHVLEYIKDDKRALSEIIRILKPNGIAVLPVPIVANKTGEYDFPNPYEFGQIRAAGLDYFERYSLFFNKVETYTSNDFPQKHQIFVYEDRTNWPPNKMSLFSPMKGEKHQDFVPVCFL